MNAQTLAYCAGVVDSDGCITIKSRKVSTKRGQPFNGRTFAASVFVRQVERGAVELLRATFGGPIRIHDSSTPGGRPLNHWELAHSAAVRTAAALLPFLRIKHEQAKILIEFDALMRNHEARRHPYWFVWQDGEPVYSLSEAATVKGIGVASVWQMVANETIPVRRERRRVYLPRRFWDSYQVSRKGRSPLPAGYMAARQDICDRIRRLNGPTRGVPVAARSA